MAATRLIYLPLVLIAWRALVVDAQLGSSLGAQNNATCTSAAFEQCALMEPQVPADLTADAIKQFCAGATSFQKCLAQFGNVCTGTNFYGTYQETIARAQIYANLCTAEVMTVINQGSTPQCPLNSVYGQVNTCYYSTFPDNWVTHSDTDICGYYNMMYQCLYDWATFTCMSDSYNSVIFGEFMIAIGYTTTSQICPLNPYNSECSQTNLNRCDSRKPAQMAAGPSLPQTQTDFYIFCNLTMQYSMCINTLNCSASDSLYSAVNFEKAMSQGPSNLCSPDVQSVILLNPNCTWNAMIRAPGNCSMQYGKSTDGCAYYNEMLVCIANWTTTSCGANISEIVAGYYSTITNYNRTAECTSPEASTTPFTPTTSISGTCSSDAITQCRQQEPAVTQNPTMDTLTMFCGNAATFLSCLDGITCSQSDSFNYRTYRSVHGIARAYLTLCQNLTVIAQVALQCPLYNASQQVNDCFNSAFPDNWQAQSDTNICSYYDLMYQCVYDWVTFTCTSGASSILDQAFNVATMDSSVSNCSFTPYSTVCSQTSLDRCSNLRLHFSSNASSLPRTKAEFDAYCKYEYQLTYCLGSIDCTDSNSLYETYKQAGIMAQTGYYLACSSDTQPAMLQNPDCGWDAVVRAPENCTIKFSENAFADRCTYGQQMASCFMDWTTQACGLNISYAVTGYLTTIMFSDLIISGNCSLLASSTAAPTTTTTAVSTTTTGFSAVCSYDEVAVCNALLPALPGNVAWSDSDFWNFCRLSGRLKSCVGAMDCSTNEDVNLYVSVYGATKLASSSQYLCTDASNARCGQNTSFIESVVLKSWSCASAAASFSNASCYSTYVPPLDGSNVYQICGYYNNLYQCQYHAIVNSCGKNAARIYMTYYIPLWQPIWLSYYCTIVSPCCTPCAITSSSCAYGFQKTLYGCDVCGTCLDPCKGIVCPAGQFCQPTPCNATADCDWMGQCVAPTTVPPPTTTTTTSLPPSCNSSSTIQQYLTSNFSLDVNSLLLCEGTSTRLQCPVGRSIDVMSAAWGRFDSQTCPRDANRSQLALRVSAAGATDVLRLACQGKTECQLTADAMTLGDPRTTGSMWTPIYLTASYACRESTYMAVQCEAVGPLVLSCPGYQRLSIQSAMFGRSDWNITCPHSTAMLSSNCSNPQSTNIVQTICNGKSSCYVDATQAVFGDPCPGTYKFLEVNYTCDACENAYGDDWMCLEWANDGMCVTNEAFMMTYCRMACTRCNDAAIACANDPAYGDAQCQAWTMNGHCATDTNFMLAHCRRTCLNCDSKTLCQDKFNASMCNVDVSMTQCALNLTWMLPSCTQSCFTCNDYVTCVDQDTRCEQWAMSGQCDINPGYMMSQCTKSCLACGQTDPGCMNMADDAVCEAQASQGACKTNAVWMFRNCWKSCLQCDGPPPCANQVGKDAWCMEMADEGQCSNATVLAACYLTCTRCGAAPVVSDCADKYPANCPSWANEGLCQTNVTFMFSNCRMTCTDCSALSTFVGGSVVPGNSNSMMSSGTSSASVIMPDTFPQSGAANYFAAFFVDQTPIYLQIWRQNLTSGAWSGVYSQKVIPRGTNQPQTIEFTACIQVQNGTDHVGFTTLYGSAPLASSFSDANMNRATYVKLAASASPFEQINLPFAFSLAVGYTPGDACS